MSDKPDTTRSLLHRLASVSSGKDVAELLCNEASFTELAKQPNEPAIRRAVMLLAADDMSCSAIERSLIAASLAKLWSIRPIRGIVDEFATRFLKTPLYELPETIPSSMWILVPAWLAGRRLEWIPEFAARQVVLNAGDQEICKAFLELLLDRSASISIALKLLNRFVAETTGLGLEIRLRNASNLSSSLVKLLIKTKMPPGKGLASEVYRFLESAVLCGELSSKSRSGELAAELVFYLIKRFPGLLMDPTVRLILEEIGAHWLSSHDKKWLRIKKEIVLEIRDLVAILGLGGIRASSLAAFARELASKPGEADKVFRELAEAYDFADHEVAEWLSNGGHEGRIEGSAESRSDAEALAAVMLRLDELGNESSCTESQEFQQISALTVELGLYAARKGLRFEGRRGELVTFDPLRQRTIGHAKPGSQVRILAPGITRKTETTSQLIIPAVVEPAGEEE